MPIVKFKPTSPGRRRGTSADFDGLSKEGPEKALVERLSRTGGRNAHGHLTSEHRGGGHRKKYRKIDFKRNKDGVPAKVVRIEYDPNRSARIALLAYADGEKRYILAPDKLRPGQKVMSGPDAEPEVGNCLPLTDMPLGTWIHNVELQPGKGGQLIRSAGSVGRLMARDAGKAHILLPSTEVRTVLETCRATIGQVSNLEHQNVMLGKAGRARWLGRRPHVRGMCKNPVDHPMGGGEARSKGHHPQSKTGVHAKGKKTRKERKPSSGMIVRRRKGKRR